MRVAALQDTGVTGSQEAATTNVVPRATTQKLVNAARSRHETMQIIHGTIYTILHLPSTLVMPQEEVTLLTERELEITTLVALGWPNKQIAAHLTRRRRGTRPLHLPMCLPPQTLQRFLRRSAYAHSWEGAVRWGDQVTS